MNNVPKDPWQAASDFGIDTSLIRSNLQLSYEERLCQHEEALKLLLEIEKARKILYGSSNQ